ALEQREREIGGHQQVLGLAAQQRGGVTHRQVPVDRGLVRKLELADFELQRSELGLVAGRDAGRRIGGNRTGSQLQQLGSHREASTGGSGRSAGGGNARPPSPPERSRRIASPKPAHPALTITASRQAWNESLGRIEEPGPGMVAKYA